MGIVVIPTLLARFLVHGPKRSRYIEMDSNMTVSMGKLPVCDHASRDSSLMLPIAQGQIVEQPTLFSNKILMESNRRESMTG